jgi:hypothetical protein
VAHVFLREGRRLLWRLLGVLGTRAVIAVCLLFAAGVAVPAFQQLWFASRATAVDAFVVRQEAELAADWTAAAPGNGREPVMAPARRLYQAVLQFTVGGRTYEVFAARRGPVHLYPVGSKEVVLFPAGQPNLARLRAEVPEFWTQAGLLLMGTVVGAGTVRWWWRMSRTRQRFRRQAGFARARAARQPETQLGLQDAGATEPAAERPNGRTA